MSDSLLETIQTIQRRAERLEQEVAELRQELARVAEVLVSPSSVVARYVIEDETYEITQADVEAVKAELAKPWTESALYELAAVKKVARKLKERSPEVQKQHFFKTVEAIRAAALANGTAIDTEAEAVRSLLLATLAWLDALPFSPVWMFLVNGLSSRLSKLSQ